MRNRSTRPSSRWRRGRIVCGFLGTLAALASVILLITDQVVFLRIGIVAALWSAAFTTIVLAWARHDLHKVERKLHATTERLEQKTREEQQTREAQETREESVSAITA